MWLRLANYYNGYCMEEPLTVYFTDHGNNRSSHKVKTYHPMIKKEARKLYGWSYQKVKRLSKKYTDS